MSGFHGRSLPEYALILGLVCMVAIPALGLLSGSIQTMFTNDTMSQADQLFSLLDKKPTPTVLSQTQAPLAKALADLTTSGGKVAMNLDAAGNLQIKLNGLPLGTTDDSTGANGGTLMTYIMADQIEALAEEVATSDPTLSARLRYLATLGRNLAQMEGYVNEAVQKGDQTALTLGQQANPSAYPFPALPINPIKGTVDTGIDLNSKELPKVYFQMHQLMIRGANAVLTDYASSPIQNRLELYTQAIDSVGNKHYTAATDVFYDSSGNKVPLATTNPSYNPSNPFSKYYLSNNLGLPSASMAQSVGSYTVDTTGVTIDVAPTFTQVTADKIAKAQEAAAATTGSTSTLPGTNYQGSALAN